VPPRKPIGKRLRFAIFARDLFTCRYCGRQADQIALHIDHIISVSKGGTNDEQNLITACVECNLGKADKAPNFTQPTESDRLRAAQELHEQKAAAERARVMLESVRQFEQDIIDMWCIAFDQHEIDSRIVPHLIKLAQSEGIERLAEWIGMTSTRLTTERDQTRIKYIYGIRRRIAEQDARAA
jgi:hypothetical protein